MAGKVKEMEELLREARKVLDDWHDEYGHYDLELMRDKIDNYFKKQTQTKEQIPTPKLVCQFCGQEFSPDEHGTRDCCFWCLMIRRYHASTQRKQSSTL